MYMYVFMYRGGEGRKPPWGFRVNLTVLYLTNMTFTYVATAFGLKAGR
jgi:hypothetical protein